jgi:hypothetical protein
MSGARVTDEVDFWRMHGDLRRCVRAVRARRPERLRWRAALAGLSRLTIPLQGLERLRIVEPVREVVLDLDDRILRREAVLDARQNGVDLDRGEVLPIRTRWDLKRTAYLTGLDHELVGRHVHLPTDFERPIDLAGVSLVARAFAASHSGRAERLQARVADGAASGAPHEQFLVRRIGYDIDMARRWVALSRTLLDGSR